MVLNPFQRAFFRKHSHTLDQIVDQDTGETFVSTVISRTVTITDAQVKALATTGIAIVPAPGVGKAIVPVSAALFMDFSAGAYTPSSGTDYFSIGTGTNAAEEMMLGTIPNTAVRIVVALGPAGSVPTTTVYGVNQAMSGLDNEALTISISGGNPTGGNAANTMTVTVMYLIVP